MGSANDKKKQQKKKWKNNGKGKEEVVTARGGEDSINHESGSKVITDARFSSVHSDPRFQRVPKKQSRKGKEEVVTAKGGEDSINHESGSKVITDARFSSVHSDPRFQRVPKKQSKVSIDSRFNRMFSDKGFSSSSTPIDKRGKPKKETAESHLRHYYRLEDEQQEEEKQQKPKEEKGEDSDGSKEESEKKSNLGRVGHGDSSSESGSESEPSKSSDEPESEASTSTSDTDDDEIGAYSEDEVSIQEEAIPEIEKETHRLAVVNMDWSQVKAVDLFVLLSSFLPKGGQILSVAVYPSEFGLKRMEEEAVRGPIGLFDSDKERSDDDDGDDEIDDEKLRAYEKSRLRYYYAVVDCDSCATADFLYKACDGVEFERSSNVLDLRFIPDSMEFKHPREIVTEPPTNYEGLDFHSRALQHSNIHLTWDEDEPQRAKTLRQKFNADQLAKLELKEFLASDDGESDDDENDEALDGQSDKKLYKHDKYRALIQSGDGSDGDGEEEEKDMEVTFNIGLEDVSKRILEKKDKKSETVWETYLRKRSEKKAAKKKNAKYSSEDDSSDTDREVPEQPDDFFIEEPSLRNGKREKQPQETDKEQEASRAELELLLADDHVGDQSLKGYNLKPKKAKGKKGKEIPVADKLPSTDYDDTRFSVLFTSPSFALDPTDPQFKRSAAYARQLAQKQQKGVQADVSGRGQMESGRKAQLPSNDVAPTEDQSLSYKEPLEKQRQELSSLVRSIKKKAQQVNLPNNNLAPKKSGLLSDRTSGKKEKHRLSALVDSVKKKART